MTFIRSIAELRIYHPRAWRSASHHKENPAWGEVWWGWRELMTHWIREMDISQRFSWLLLAWLCTNVSPVLYWKGELQGLLWLPLWLSFLQCGRPEFNPWIGKMPWRRERLPLPVFWPGEFYRLYSPWGRKELDTTERLSLSRQGNNWDAHWQMNG